MGEEIEELTGEIKKLQNENQTLDLKLKSKINETVNLNAELEQIEFKSTGYYNQLQKPREENNELKAELDILKNQMENLGHLKQGNSLFGEVDDERREMEKKLSSFQIKYESLSKAHAFLVSQNRNMKVKLYFYKQLSQRLDWKLLLSQFFVLCEFLFKNLRRNSVRSWPGSKSCNHLNSDDIRSFWKR